MKKTDIITLKIGDAYQVVKLCNVIYIKASGSYSEVFILDKN